MNHYLRFIAVGISLFSTCAFADIQRTQNGLNLQTQLNKKATYFLSDVAAQLDGSAPMGDLAKIKLSHVSNDQRASYFIKVVIYNSIVPGKALGSLVSMQAYEVNGTTITMIDLKSDRQNFSIVDRLSASDISNAIQQNFGSMGALSTKYAGILPPNEAIYEISVYKSENGQQGPLVLTASESINIPYESGYISIQTPRLGETISGDQIQLMWTPVRVRAGIGVSYFVYFSTDPSFTPQNAQYSIEVKNVNRTIASFSEMQRFGLNGANKIYWRVFAKDETGAPIGLEGKSTISYFSKLSQLPNPINASPLAPPQNPVTPLPNPIPGPKAANKPALPNPVPVPKPVVQEASAVKNDVNKALNFRGVTSAEGWKITKVTVDGVQIPFENYLEMMRFHNNTEALQELK